MKIQRRERWCLRSIRESEIKKGFLEEVAFETDSEERVRFWWEKMVWILDSRDRIREESDRDYDKEC